MARSGKKQAGLKFGPGRDNPNRDFVFKCCNLPKKGAIDVLIFSDSRSSNIKSINDSWSMRMFRYFKDKKMSVMLVVRPKECTVFLTLVNFLESNKLYFKHLITEIGLVDFTPKKIEIINDILDQKAVYFKKARFRVERLSKYLLSNGEIKDLYSIDFNRERFKKEIADCIERHSGNAILMGTLEVSQGIKIKRNRPKEFFTKLKDSNRFLAGICGMSGRIEYLYPFEGAAYRPEKLSYDGVHYTGLGHGQIYKVIKEAFTAKGSPDRKPGK
ncbi:MAG: hypothetical protein PHO67_02305 [Candidatus Omnitrophica bacterium]|nr:hypothetical protein [Candidatus Omnitrophota bacterium]MDD5545980.1 hypothetical protein [Candidatus Omnitrophota bacterium]